MEHIMKLNISSDEKIDILMEDYSTVHSHLIRKISVDEPLNLQVGDTISELGESWSDFTDPNYSEYRSEIYGKYTYIFEVHNCKGLKLIYDYDLLNEQWYYDLMWILNTSPELYYECEVLVSNNIQFTVSSITKIDDFTVKVSVF